MSEVSNSRMKIYDSVLQSYADPGSVPTSPVKLRSPPAPTQARAWHDNAAVVPIGAFIVTFMVLVAIGPPFVQNKQRDGINSTSALVISLLAALAVAGWPWIYQS
jgi:hypothetical protein